MKECKANVPDFKEYRDKISGKEISNGNIFIRNYKDINDFIDFFKCNETSRYTYLDDAIEYLAYSDRFSKWHYPSLIEILVNNSSSVEGSGMVSKLTIYMVITYIGDKKCTTTLLESAVAANYDDAFQIAIDLNAFNLVDYMLDKVKLTSEHFDAIIKRTSARDAIGLLSRCALLGIYPKVEDIYQLLGRGVDVPSDIISIYGIINDSNVNYVQARIRGNLIDFRREKLKRYEFNDADKEKIKVAIFESINLYIDKNLDAFSKMFNIKYDENCLNIFSTISTDHKIFKYLVGLGIKPNYDMMCKIVSRLSTKSQIKKFF
jgi:hypothetical protein